jgi:hypothetical protein
VKISTFKSIIFFLLLFVLLYFEDRVHLGAISLSNVWKTVVIFIFLFYSFDKIMRNNAVNAFSRTALFLSLSLFIGPGKLNFLDIEEVITVLILPISYYSFYYLYKNNSHKLTDKMLLLSCFLILSSLPFIFGFLEALKTDVLEAELYGLDKGVLIGLFKHPSLSSKVFVFSTLYLFVYGLAVVKKAYGKVMLIGVIFIGMYSIYLSFTRTGWFMLLFGIVFSIVYNKNFKAYFTKVVPLLILVSFGLFYVYNTNETIQRRINSDRIGRENATIDYMTLITSGRDVLIINAVQTVSEGGVFSMIFGLGKQEALQKNNDTLAHNRFVEIFQYGGLISLTLFLLYLYYLYQEFSKRKNKSVFYKLSLIFFLLLIMSLIPSHGLPIWADILFGGVLALNRMQFENDKNSSIHNKIKE